MSINVHDFLIILQIFRGVDAGEAEKLFGIFSLRKGSVKNAINSKILGSISDALD